MAAALRLAGVSCCVPASGREVKASAKLSRRAAIPGVYWLLQCQLQRLLFSTTHTPPSHLLAFFNRKPPPDQNTDFVPYFVDADEGRVSGGCWLLDLEWIKKYVN